MIYNAFRSFISKKVDTLGAHGSAVDLDPQLTSEITVHTMRLNQQEVYDKYGNLQYLVITEPPGAGKSTTVKFVMAKRLLKDKNHKVIISIPTTLIAKSFGRIMLKFPDGEQVEWDMEKNLCSGVTFQRKTNAIIKFLKTTKFTKGIHERILITTHMALARAGDRLIGIADLFKDTTLVIDEAHHILYPENGDSTSANKIGNLIYKIMSGRDPSTSVWLTTATFFRGDKGIIISEDVMNQFGRYFLPLDEHWRDNIKHIESFEFNFVMYKDDIIEDAMAVFKHHKRKTIVFCPYTGPLLEGRSKLEFRDNLIAAITNVWPECSIVDLIDEEGRDSRKNLLLKNKTAKEVDVILAVKMFDEGSDWVYAEQVLDLVPPNSLRIQVQRMGRTWRDLPGKRHILYFSFLPNKSKFTTDEEKRRYCANNLNALIASMILHEAIDPIKYPKDTHRRSINPFEKAVPDEGKRHTILAEIMKQLVIIKNAKKDPTSLEMLDGLRRVLKQYNVDDPYDAIALHIGLMFRRSTGCSPPRHSQKEGTNIKWMADAGYDEIFKKDIYDGLLVFGSKANGVETFDSFRQIYNDNQRSVDEWVLIAEYLAEQNFGLLPRNKRLIDMGYSGLVGCMCMNPERFAHIVQEPRLKTNFTQIDGHTVKPSTNVYEQVNIAKSLSLLNEGILPSDTWLIQNKHIKLVIMMRDNPNAFAGIMQFGPDGNVVMIAASEEVSETSHS